MQRLILEANNKKLTYNNEEDILSFASRLSNNIGFAIEDNAEEDYIVGEILALEVENLNTSEIEKEIALKVINIIISYYDNYIYENFDPSKINTNSVIDVTRNFITEYFVTNYKEGKRIQVNFLNKQLRQKIENLLSSSVKLSKESFRMNNITEEFAELIMQNS